MLIYFLDNSSTGSGIHTLAEQLNSIDDENLYRVILNQDEVYEHQPSSKVIVNDSQVSHDPIRIFNRLKTKVNFDGEYIYIFPNNSTVAYDVALRLKRFLTGRGLNVFVIGILHSNHPASISLIGDNAFFLDLVVSVSRSAERALLDTYTINLPKLIHKYPITLPNRRKRSLRRSGEKLRVVYVGRLEEDQKKFSRVIEVIRALGQTGQQISFDIFGDGTLRENLMEVLVDSPGTFGVTLNWHGWVSNSIILSRLPDFDVIILTSDFEGMPISVMESMASGVVPLVMNFGEEVSELIETNINGVVVPKGDVASMVRELLNLQADFRRLEDLRKGALESSQRFCSPREWLNALIKNKLDSKPIRGRETTSFELLKARVEAKLSSLEAFKGYVIWGAGTIGKLVVDYLLRVGINSNSLIILDRELGRKHMTYRGILIYDPSKLIELDFDLIIIASEYYLLDIKSTISNLLGSRTGISVVAAT